MKYVAIEYQDSGEEQHFVDDLARDFGLPAGKQLRVADEIGQHSIRIYPVGRSRRRAEDEATRIADYLEHAAPYLPWSVWVHPPLGWTLSRLRDFGSLLWWVVRHPRDPDCDHNLYLLRCQAKDFLHDVAPLHRCDCGGFTRVLWRRRDPHFRGGKWVGPDDCLPF